MAFLVGQHSFALVQTGFERLANGGAELLL